MSLLVFQAYICCVPPLGLFKLKPYHHLQKNYEALVIACDVAMDDTWDREMKTRITGVSALMEKFDFFYGKLGRKFLNMVGSDSRSLQSKTISACEGQNLELVLRIFGEKNSYRSSWILQHYNGRGKFLTD